MKTFRNTFGGTLGVIIAIIGITPQLLKDVGTFMDELYTYIPSWGWLIISALIFIVLWVWNKVEDTQESKQKLQQSNSSPSQLHSGSGDNVAGDKNVYYGNGKKKDELFEIHNEILVLMNKAIEDITWFTNGYQIEGEPSLDEKKKIAFYSGKAFHECLEKNKHLFREDLSNFLEDIDILSSLTIEREIIAIGGSSRDTIFENEIRNEWKEKSKVLKQRVTKEFHKRFPD